MKFFIDHNNINVFNLDKSRAFYAEALGFSEVRSIEAPDKSFILAFLSDEVGRHKVELTWLRERSEPYNLGDNEIHLAVRTDDYNAAHALHQKMGCICYENPAMGLYFISDPDGYWIEILPQR